MSYCVSLVVPCPDWANQGDWALGSTIKALMVVNFRLALASWTKQSRPILEDFSLPNCIDGCDFRVGPGPAVKTDIFWPFAFLTVLIDVNFE